MSFDLASLAMSQEELDIGVPRLPTPDEKRKLAVEYGTTVRTLDRIVAKAEAVKSIPDLFNARELEKWVVTYTGRKASRWLREAASKVVGEVAEAGQEPVMVAAVNFDEAQESADMGLSTMRKIVSLAGLEVAEAYESGDKLRRADAMRELSEAQKSLRLLEKTAVELEKSGGDLVSKEKIATVMVRQVKRLGSVMQKELEDFLAGKFPELEREEIRQEVVEVRDRAFGNFKVDLPA